MDDYQLTVSGLLRKRGELTSQVEMHRAQLDTLLAALDHIDATIRVFKPDIDIQDMPERPAPPANAAFRGEVQRFLLDTLRKASGPLTTSQMAEAVMHARRLNTGDRVLFRLIAKRTGHSLSRLRKQGLAASERYSKGAELRWRSTALAASERPLLGWRNGSIG